MKNDSSTLHFPSDIKLKSHPLIEAWLEIQWQLQPTDHSQFMKDPAFPFALGAFYSSIQNDFRFKEDLEASKAPTDILPHVVRHRFRKTQQGWPILQIGPGVASVNFTEPYTWNDFKQTALYLRSKLIGAYKEKVLIPEKMILRYRNAISFDSKLNNFFDVLKNKLNVSILMPPYIPGDGAIGKQPVNANIVLNFNLSEPKGIGTVQFATGARRPQEDVEKESEPDVLMWQLEVASEKNNAPSITSEKEFVEWLTASHTVIHEWFFSIIDGQLFKEYSGEGE